MKKNGASQVISFFMFSDGDGKTPITSGTPVVYYTIDGGTQATGAGTATHEGNGEWSYALPQAETNGNHIGYMMTLTGALPCGANVYPSYPQSVDLNTALSAVQTHGDSSWATATGFSTHSAADVWSYSTRTLSSFGTLVSEIATAVWGATTRTLSSISDSAGITTLLSRLSSARTSYLDKLNVTGTLAHSDAAATYKADVSGLSTITEAAVNAQVDQAIADVGLTTTITGRIDAAVSSRLASGNVTVGDVSTAALAKFASTDTGRTTAVSGSVAALSQGEAGSLTPEAVADAVWDEALGDHTTAGSGGAALSAAGAAGVSGSAEFSYTVTSSNGAVVPQTRVEIYAEEDCTTLLRTGFTNDLGVYTTRLDPGTYYIWLSKAGVRFDDLPDSQEVTA